MNYVKKLNYNETNRMHMLSIIRYKSEQVILAWFAYSVNISFLQLSSLK